jgi:hypothetical protein
MKKIGILGASSSVFRSLLYSGFFSKENQSLTLFVRRPVSLRPVTGTNFEFEPLREFENSNQEFEDVYSFIGSGNPILAAKELTALIEASFFWDEITVRMLRQGRATRFFSMSSGIADERYKNISSQYRSLKVELENRHQLEGLAIFDIRIFGFADANGKFFPGSLVGDLKRSLQGEKSFVTDHRDFTRDYCGAAELSLLLSRLQQGNHQPGPFELASLAPVAKFKLINYLVRNKGLMVSKGPFLSKTMSGEKSSYVPSGSLVPAGYVPQRNSLEVVLEALGAL